MKIVIISDTHGRHEELGILSGDVLIHCGDVCDGYAADDDMLDSVDEWFAQQQFNVILCTGGNHDRAMQQRVERNQTVFQHAIYLEDEEFEFKGVKFYGAPWVPYVQGWAYYQDDATLQSKWAKIPNNTDILITHTPPLNILDTPSFSNAHFGCPYLQQRVERICPKFHCFGHVHASYGKKKIRSTTFINASFASRSMLNSPITIKL